MRASFARVGERFNRRVQRAVLGITLDSYRDFETVLRGVSVAYNGWRQRVRDGLLPEMVLHQRLEAGRTLADPAYTPPSPCPLERALRAVADARAVSHPDG